MDIIRLPTIVNVANIFSRDVRDGDSEETELYFL